MLFRDTCRQILMLAAAYTLSNVVLYDISAEALEINPVVIITQML